MSCNEPNQQAVVRLKQDIEAFTNLCVVLENDDWEEVEDWEFERHIHQADALLSLATETSVITAWMIDVNKRIPKNEPPPTQISSPPTINIWDSCYEEGFKSLLVHIAQNMDRRYGPPQAEHEEEEEKSESTTEEKEKEAEEHESAADYENSLRDLFAKSNVRLDRTDALRARRRNRVCRRNSLQESRGD